MRPRSAALTALLTLGVLVLVLAQAAIAPAKGAKNEYSPPYKKGGSGGDFANFTWSDPSSGRVAILRAYPVFNPFGCGDSQGGYITLRVRHDVTAPVRSVEVRYADTFVDPYSFLTVGVKSGNRYLGAKEVRGPIGGDGKILVPLNLGNARPGSTLTIDFGAEVSSACPNADGVTAEFTKVMIHRA